MTDETENSLRTEALDKAMEHWQKEATKFAAHEAAGEDVSEEVTRTLGAIMPEPEPAG